MLDGAHAVHELLHELAERGFIEGAAGLARRGLERDGVAHFEMERRPHAAHLAPQVSGTDPANLAEGQGARDEAGQDVQELAEWTRDAFVRPARETPPSFAKHRLGVRATPNEPRDARGLLGRGPLPALHGLVVAADLRVHGVAQPEALGAELLHELGLQLAIGEVHRADGLEETQGQERIDSGGHARGWETGRELWTKLMVESVVPALPASQMQDTISLDDRISPCAAFAAMLDDVVSSQSDALSTARVEAHAALCPPCRLALSAARAYRSTMLRVGGAVRASAALRDRAFGVLREVRGPRQT